MVPLAIVMNRTGNEFFSRSPLSTEENRGLCIRHLSDGFIDLKHLRGSSNDIFKLVLVQKFLSIKFIFLDKPSLLQGPPDSKFDLVQFKRFADVVVGSFTDGLDGSLNGSEGSDHDHGGVRSVLFEESKHLHPVFLPHSHIRDDNVEKIVFPL